MTTEQDEEYIRDVSTIHESSSEHSLYMDVDMEEDHSQSSKHRASTSFMKPVDRGEYKIHRIIKNKRVPIMIFTTCCTPGCHIRNAQTGIFENFLVGNYTEDLFFKVSICTGELGKNPYGKHLFYHSPEDYERHFDTTVPQKTKKEWMEKFLSTKKRYLAEKEKKKNI